MKTRRTAATNLRLQVASLDVVDVDSAELAARMRRAALLFKWPELLGADVRQAMAAKRDEDTDWLAVA